jgi:hypothetical protein
MCVWLDFVLMLTIFHHPGTKNFVWRAFLRERKRQDGKHHLFSCKKARQTKSFCPSVVKNGQHQHKDRPHTQEKCKGAATSVEDAIIILRGLNLCGVHCTVRVARDSIMSGGSPKL